MNDESLEGWYTDPYGRHAARWLSRGEPTKLVRNGMVESYDAPPDEPPTRLPERIAPEPVTEGDDLRRADDPERAEPYDQKRANRPAWDAYDGTPQWG